VKELLRRSPATALDELKLAVEDAVLEAGGPAEQLAVAYALLHFAAGVALTVGDAMGQSRERAIERFVARALETVSKVSEKHPRCLDG
jgi:hypothetical protein